MDDRALRPGQLAGTLLAASDWFNDALVAQLGERGWPRLNRTQSLVFATLAGGSARPAELARRIGITRQSMQSVLRGLADQDLVTLERDPHDGRSLRVGLTARGRELMADAERLLVRLEGDLEARIGRDAILALRHSLGLWRAQLSEGSGPRQG